MSGSRRGKELDLGQYDLLTKRTIEGDYVLTSSSKDAEPFKDGDLIVRSVGAGGGYGDVLDRDPALVVRDLEEDLITPDVAERIYGVVIDRQTRLVDQASNRETARQRSAPSGGRRASRSTISSPNGCKRKPKADILHHYGNWPEPQLESYDKPFWGMYD